MENNLLFLLLGFIVGLASRHIRFRQEVESKAEPVRRDANNLASKPSPIIIIQDPVDELEEQLKKENAQN